jgi:uncharacterized protein HemY
LTPIAARALGRATRKEFEMTTAETIMEQALDLAIRDTDRELAARELATLFADRRVAVVRAKQQLADRSSEDPADMALQLASDYLDGVLQMLPAS